MFNLNIITTEGIEVIDGIEKLDCNYSYNKLQSLPRISYKYLNKIYSFT